MNRTNNYNLCQWEAEDKIQRTDFNADNAKIDQALKNLEAVAAGKIDETALEPFPRMLTGSYVGTGVQNHTLHLEVKPKLLMVFGSRYQSFMVYGCTTASCMNYSNGYHISVTWSNEGRTVYWASGRDTETALNTLNETYTYFALC